MAETQHPLNKCARCDNTWFPKGADKADKCPKCGDPRVFVVFNKCGACQATWPQRSSKVYERCPQCGSDQATAVGPPPAAAGSNARNCCCCLGIAIFVLVLVWGQVSPAPKVGTGAPEIPSPGAIPRGTPAPVPTSATPSPSAPTPAPAVGETGGTPPPHITPPAPNVTPSAPNVTPSAPNYTPSAPPGTPATPPTAIDQASAVNVRRLFEDHEKYGRERGVFHARFLAIERDDAQGNAVVRIDSPDGPVPTAQGVGTIVVPKAIVDRLEMRNGVWSAARTEFVFETAPRTGSYVIVAVERWQRFRR